MPKAPKPYLFKSVFKWRCLFWCLWVNESVIIRYYHDAWFVVRYFE